MSKRLRCSTSVGGMLSASKQQRFSVLTFLSHCEQLYAFSPSSRSARTKPASDSCSVLWPLMSTETQRNGSGRCDVCGHESSRPFSWCSRRPPMVRCSKSGVPIALPLPSSPPAPAPSSAAFLAASGSGNAMPRRSSSRLKNSCASFCWCTGESSGKKPLGSLAHASTNLAGSYALRCDDARFANVRCTSSRSFSTCSPKRPLLTFSGGSGAVRRSRRSRGIANSCCSSEFM
mmetsp:Transcript_6357/g.22697  ORF Transcript_6357/g.22697 Transcript_6357/m.22697 type:complete len:232 (-) Transcript_6357:1-696(-)